MRPRRAPEVVLENVTETLDSLNAEILEKYAPFMHLYMYLLNIRLAGGKDIDYETLAAVSGLGSTFFYHRASVVGVYAFLPDEDGRIARATGYSFKRSRDCDTAGKTWDFIRASVNSGSLVQAEHEERMAFAGYQDASETAGRRVFIVGGFFDSRGVWWSWEQFDRSRRMPGDKSVARLAGRVERAPNRSVGIEVLENIVAWSAADPRAEYPWVKNLSGHCKPEGFQWGLAGMEAFADDLADRSLKREDFKSGWHCCFAVNPQWTARKGISIWLRRVARPPGFPENTVRFLLSAAEKYKDAYTAWSAFYRIGNNNGAWEDDNARESMASSIRKAAQSEREAVSLAAQALDALE